MLISVIIPTYQRVDLLVKCLECLRPGVQTLAFEDYEVIVSDDGLDQTAEATVAEKYPWARWIPGPRRGPAANRNSGARQASGEWLAFTDDDCLPSSQWLSAYNVAIASQSTDQRTKIFEGRTTCEAGITTPTMQSPINLTGGWLWSCNMMVQRELFLTLGGFDESFPRPHMEDTEFRERIRRMNYQFGFVAEAVVDHPPRPILFGAKHAALHECDIVYCHRLNLPVEPVLRHLFKESKNRLRHILRFPLSTASVVAAVSAAIELAVVALRYRSWVRKHGGRTQ